MSQGQEAGQHLQELSEQLEELDQVQNQLRTQLEAARARREDVSDAIEALADLETDSVVQVPLGADAYVKARIEDVDEVIVTLGADFSAEQSREEAIGTLEQRAEQIEEQIERLQENLSDVSADIQEVEGRAQQLRQQMLQQQSQQLGGMGLGGEGG